MKFLVLSDIHGAADALDKLDAEFAAADVVLFGGDFAKFGAAETGKPVLDKLAAKHDTVFAVRGNCDEPDFIADMEAADLSVEGALTFAEGLAFTGTGGGTKFTGETPFERDEADILADLDAVSTSDGLSALGGANALVVIMHNPPKDTACDALPNGVHVGSAQLRAFIDETQPLLVVTGHIHESAGIDTVGTTTVINPGSLAEGKYAWAETERTDNGTWRVTKAELRTL